MEELSIIQKTYDLIKWYVPILNRLPKSHQRMLGERMIGGLYDLFDGLIEARYDVKEKLTKLERLNIRLELLRYQTRMLLDFQLIADYRYEHAAKFINEIGMELGGWIRQQRRR